MDINKYKNLLKKEVDILTRFTLQTQFIVRDPQKIQEVMNPLADGTIDDGDFEEVSKHLLNILSNIPEYKELKKFYKNNSKKFCSMYRELLNATPEEFDEFAREKEKIAIDVAVEWMFNMLKDLGMVTDRRTKKRSK